MSVPLWVCELADAFWAVAGPPGPFPRDLTAAVAGGWPLAVVDLPRLSLGAAHAWLTRNGVTVHVRGPDRRLRAGLVSGNGQGFVFLDADDLPDERRFSLAHEVAHYLRDDWAVRERAARRLGRNVLAVFDGERPATDSERLGAALANLPLRVNVHLLRREAGELPPDVAVAERAADRLAYELLAPADLALGRSITELAATFGLPRVQAERYAAILDPVPSGDPLLLRLRDASEKCR